MEAFQWHDHPSWEQNRDRDLPTLGEVAGGILVIDGKWQWSSEPNYRQISNTKGIKSSNLDISRLILQLHLPNPLKPGVKSRMKM